jgi:hypothetical protein
MAKPSKYYDIALHNALLKRDEWLEPNLTDGPQDRKVTWAFLKRTIPSFDDEYLVLRGFPDE